MNRNEGQVARPGNLVRTERQASGLTQRELARRAGVSIGTVRDLEQGRTHRPLPRSLDGLTRALGLSSEQLREPAGVPAGSGLFIEVLGPLAVWRDGAPVPVRGPARRAVLGLLALSPGSPVHREVVIDALWPDEPPANAVNLVQVHVSRLRRLIDPSAVVAGRPPRLSSAGCSYRLQIGLGELDLLALGRRTADARAAISRADDEGACVLFQQALELWRGEPLGDVDLLRSRPEVVRLSRQRAEMVIEYARVASSAGRHDQVLDPLRNLAAGEPLNEQAHAQLMIALAGCGQQAKALAIYQDLCRRLDKELAVRPSPALTDAHQRVLRQDIAPARSEQAAVTLDTAVVRSRGAGPVVPRQLPAAPELFVGREADLSALGRLPEAAAGAVVISVIGGTAGVGKTTLAVHWAHEVAACFPDGQLYVNLRGFGPSAGPVPPSQAVGWFLDALGVAPDGMPTSLEARTGLYRSLVAGKRLLILLDNARDADQVRPLLPGSPGCLVLVTSRARLLSLAVGEGARLLSLDVLTEPEARRMLAGRLGTERVAAEPGAIDELIVLCARLPLALAIIAGCAADRRALPLAALTAGLRDSAGRLDLLEGGDSASSLRAVLSWSYDQLTGPAARMFRLLGLHPGPDITAQAAASLAGTPLTDVRRALAELTAAGLLAEQPPGRFGFHDLLRVYAREKTATATGDADRRAALGRALDHYLHTAHAAAVLQYPLRETITLPPLAPDVVPEHLETADQALAWFEAEHQVLGSVVVAAATAALDASTWRLAWAAAEYFDRKGQFDEQATIVRAGLAAAERLGDIAGQAASVRMLAHNSARRGNYDQAEADLERCLPLYRMLGDCAGEARVQQTFSFVRGRQGRYAEAAAHCEQALAIHRALGDRHGEAAALNNLAWNLALVGELSQASELCQRSLHLHRQLGSICEGLSWDTLGFITSGLGRHVDAADCYEHALAVFRRHHHRLYEADTLAHLGDAWDAAGRPRDARDAWQQALHILDDLHHPGASQVLAKLHDPTAPVRA